MENILKPVWCHACRHEFFQSPSMITCGMCDSELIEQIEPNCPHPNSFRPEGITQTHPTNFNQISLTTHFIHFMIELPSEVDLSATESQINSLESIEHSNQECAICQDSIAEGKIMPCGHHFHSQCITKWLKMKNSCPTCRTSV